MNRIFHLLIVITATALMACEKPVAESASGDVDVSDGGAHESVVRPKFRNGCADWDGASIKVSTLEDHWILTSYGKSGCADKPRFEQRYELDSEFLGVWKHVLLVGVGTADADRELYVVNPDSGDRIGELWYVGEPVFSDQSITYFEPTREPAKLEQCPQPLSDLKRSQEQGAVIMYSSKKKFDLDSGNTAELQGRGCYTMR